MINSQFSLDINTVQEYKKLKKTPMYTDYIKTITSSPIFGSTLSEHIKDIDITEDIKKYKDTSPSQLNNAVKSIMTKLAINIIADTIILRELAECKINDVSKSLSEDFSAKYVMGLADDSHYKQAEELLSKVTSIDKSSVIYIGLIEYKKRNGLIKTAAGLTTTKKEKEKEKEIKVVETSPVELDIDSNDISL